MPLEMLSEYHAWPVMPVLLFHRPFPSQCLVQSSSPTLGQLDLLPLEFLHAILQVGNLEFIRTFKLLNRYARTIVNSCREYRLTVATAPNVLRGIHKFGAASLFTVLDVLNALYSQSCSFCGGPAAILILISSCSRCCYQCIRKESTLQAVSGFEAKSRFCQEGKVTG